MSRFFAALALAFLGARVQASTLTVFAAASLRESFTTLATQYEAAHPGVTIRLNFAGSQTLAAQIQQGAPADVFASAGVEAFVSVPAYGPGVRLASNSLVVVTPSNSRRVKSLADLSKVGRLVVAAKAVPAGGYARKMLALGGKQYGDAWLQQVQSHIVSEEQDVRAVLAKVQLGEADAGIVYRTDAVTTKVRVVAIPQNLQVKAEYWIGVPSTAPDRVTASAFVRFVTSKAGRLVLSKQGLGLP